MLKYKVAQGCCFCSAAAQSSSTNSATTIAAILPATLFFVRPLYPLRAIEYPPDVSTRDVPDHISPHSAISSSAAVMNSSGIPRKLLGQSHSRSL